MLLETTYGLRLDYYDCSCLVNGLECYLQHVLIAFSNILFLHFKKTLSSFARVV